MNFVLKNNRGFSMVEIIVATGIGIMFFLAIYQMLVFSHRAMSRNLRKIEATHFAQESIEALRSMRNDSWMDNINNLSSDTVYYPVLQSDEWTMSATPQALVNGMFDRSVILYDVYRDEDHYIAESGTADTSTRRVVASVSWSEHGSTSTIYLEAFITDFLKN